MMMRMYANSSGAYASTNNNNKTLQKLRFQ